ncbi:ATP-binding protein [Polyangium fumosum]|uniref:ATP-binding protein n=1 Tax=Polyangium fumosum TaxID=889272 RepID=UPI001479032A|nr:ATP-binding protein [Polyangium fumosum]
MTNESRLELLRTLRSNAGQAEAGGRVEANFYPIAEHLRALEPDVVLIVGDRGAGKTELVRVAGDADLREAVQRRMPKVRLAKGDTNWLRGYPMDYGPAKAGLEKFILSSSRRTTAQEVWFAYLLRALEAEPEVERFQQLIRGSGAEVDARHADFLAAGNATTAAMDDLDKRLVAEERWVFVMYDELDTLYYSDWSAMGELIRGLIAFWVHHSRRWSRIRPKIFLRTDFYRHHGSDVAGADVAKLAANRVELTWSDKNLYAVLIKHLANLSDEWFDYCTTGQGEKVHYDDDPVLGHVPILVKKDEAKPLIERIVGKYMGPTGRKGEAFTWIIDHLRDGNQKVSPRSLILLFETAAILEAGTMHAKHAQVLSHISLRNALDKVSDAYVTQANDEFRWLPEVKERLKAIAEVPWRSRSILEGALGKRWEAWFEQGPEQRPPAKSAKDLVDLLLELGIVRDRGGDKFDVPDLYLKGLGLKRKGGVARKVVRNNG